MSANATIATVFEMGELDLTTPFDELAKLRSVLTVGEIAEMTGLRRETLSRARPDSRFQRRTEKALTDLYLVVNRMKPMLGDDDTHLAAVLRRPQPLLEGRSIAELVKEGRAEAVLEHLAPPAPLLPTEKKELANFKLPPEIEAELEAGERARPDRAPAKDPEWDRRASAILAADPELDSSLPAIETAIHEYFGPESRIERQIIEPYDIPGGSDRLYLRVYTDLAFREEMDRFAAFIEQERDLLQPVLQRLTVGFL